MDYQIGNYSHQPIWKVIVLYVIIGVVACGLVYFFFFYKGGIGTYNLQHNEDQVESEILTNDSLIAKTYTSDNYYFSVLWPPSWKIKKETMGIVLSGKEGSFNIAWNGLGGACDEDEIKEFTKGEDSYWICDQKTDGSYQYATIAKVTNEDIAIGIVPQAHYSSEDEKWVFMKVIDSIKLDPQGIASWKTYNNDQYGFIFKYPENFFVEDPQMLTNQCDYEKLLKECPDRMDEKIIINGVQYCHSQSKEGAGQTLHHDYYLTSRNGLCLSILLKTPQENEKRLEIIEKIVPTFKFTK